MKKTKEKINEKKLGKLKKKSNFEKKTKKKRKVKKKKKWGRITMDYCCNPQWNVCGGTVIPPHGLVYVLIVIFLFYLLLIFYFLIILLN